MSIEIDPADRALAFIDAELRGMKFRREALLHIRELIVSSVVVSEMAAKWSPPHV